MLTPRQTNRNAAWYSTLGVVTIFGSLLAYGLGHIQSDVLHSYQVSDGQLPATLMAHAEALNRSSSSSAAF